MKNQKAFTMIELLITMGVIALFTSLFFVDYGAGSNSLALERVVKKTAQDLRKTQEMAMSATIGETNTNGYGIYFDKTSGNEKKYIIYSNTNSNMYYESGTDTIKETVNMETGVKICSISISDGTSTSLNNVSISFQPPDPINYINSYYSGYEASIVFCTDDEDAITKIVKINNVGRIETTNQ